MWRYISLALVSIVVVVFGFSLVEVGAGTGVGAGAAVQSADVNLEDYPRAVDPNYDWNFPEDHGPHNDFLTEWWYYTGNVATADGRRFGFQFTIFRRAILPEDQVQDSEWRTRQMYLGHVTISDIAADEFYQEERYSRGAAGLAGATADPRYRVWLEDWEVVALNDDATEVHMVATAGNASMDIVLTQAKPIVFQGEQGNGLSFKGGEEGNASYYYSIPRLETEGTFTIGDETFEVTGNTWMDREFSTSALAEGAVGWDWFGLIFDDNTELMLYHIRLEDGSTEPASAGLYIDADGNYTYLHSEDYTMTPLDTWTSPVSGGEYPSGWEITIDGEVIGLEDSLDFRAIPLMEEQELITDPNYWEGAVRLEGDKTGYGYNEMTGYTDRLDDRL